jgi:hypothetical protein
LTYTNTGFVNGDLASVVSGVPALSTTATTGSAPGNYPITVSTGTLSAANYSFLYVSGTLTIQPANQSALTLIAASPLTFNQSESLSVTGGSSTGAVTYNLVSGPCGLSGSTLTANSGTGSCVLTATKAADGNYNSVTSAPVTVTLALANQAALNLIAASPLAFNGSEPLSATGGSSTGSVTFNLVSGPCGLSGSTLTANSGTGSCVLTATKAADANYNSVTSAQVSVTLGLSNQAALTLIAGTPLAFNKSETLSVTGGSSNGTVTYNLVSGPCTISGSQLTANSGTGSCGLTATMAGNANYSPVTSAQVTVALGLANQAALILTTTPLTYLQSETLHVTGGSTNGTVTCRVSLWR